MAAPVNTPTFFGGLRVSVAEREFHSAISALKESVTKLNVGADVRTGGAGSESAQKTERLGLAEALFGAAESNQGLFAVSGVKLSVAQKIVYIILVLVTLGCYGCTIEGSVRAVVGQLKEGKDAAEVGAALKKIVGGRQADVALFVGDGKHLGPLGKHVAAASAVDNLANQFNALFSVKDKSGSTASDVTKFDKAFELLASASFASADKLSDAIDEVNKSSAADAVVVALNKLNTGAAQEFKLTDGASPDKFGDTKVGIAKFLALLSANLNFANALPAKDARVAVAGTILAGESWAKKVAEKSASEYYLAVATASESEGKATFDAKAAAVVSAFKTLVGSDQAFEGKLALAATLGDKVEGGGITAELISESIAEHVRGKYEAHLNAGGTSDTFSVGRPANLGELLGAVGLGIKSGEVGIKATDAAVADNKVTEDAVAAFMAAVEQCIVWIKAAKVTGDKTIETLITDAVESKKRVAENAVSDARDALSATAKSVPPASAS
ncbi:MAG: hypothetical protein LBI39_02380 [Puniceicoccales bacterium]|jgi:hypothetical protein|nr:hypothetical protein [Puniceicoccales bacterium]